MAENTSVPISATTSSSPPIITPVVTPISIPQSPSAASFIPSNPPTSLLTVKLSNENYLLWKAQVLPYLKGHNLHRFIDGTTPPPQLLDGLTESNPSFLLWQQQDQAVMSILISSLTEPLIAHVLEATTARDVWIILESMFAATSQARWTQILFQLTSLQKGSESIADYFRRAKLLLDTLALAGKVIPPTEFIVYLLHGLPDDYEVIVDNIITHPEAYSLSQVYSHLLNYEARQLHKLNTTPASTEFSANSTLKSIPNYSGRGRGPPRGRGNYRGRGGKGRSGGRGLLPTPLFSPTNTAATCYHRFNYNYQTPPPSSLTAHYTTGPSPFPHSSTDSSWYPDTAATHHFTHDFSNLTINPVDYQGQEHVQVGNGSSLPIQHVGSTTLPSSHGFQNSHDSSSRAY